MPRAGQASACLIRPRDVSITQAQLGILSRVPFAKALGRFLSPWYSWSGSIVSAAKLLYRKHMGYRLGRHEALANSFQVQYVFLPYRRRHISPPQNRSIIQVKTPPPRPYTPLPPPSPRTATALLSSVDAIMRSILPVYRPGSSIVDTAVPFAKPSILLLKQRHKGRVGKGMHSNLARNVLNE